MVDSIRLAIDGPRIQQKRVDLSLGTLTRIAKAFEMTVSELFEGVA
jgi:hypothetical protein